LNVPFTKRELIGVAALLFVAFMVRFLFFSNQGYASVDTYDFSLWFQRAADIGPRLFYSNNYFCDYPPFNIYFFWAFGLIAKNLSLFGSTMFTYVMKLPANLFDMATAFLIFIFVRKRLNFKWALIATALYAFNPAVIYDAAVWGQFDAIYTCFLALSLVLVFSSKPKLAVVAYMVGVLTKPQSIALAPLIFFLVWRKTDWKGVLTSILIAAATVFAVILPFEWSNPVTFLSNIYFNAYNGYQWTTINAFNIWGFAGMWVADTQLTFILGWTMFAAVAAFALYYVHKRFSVDKELVVLLAAFLLFFAFFMLPTRIHERYLFPAFAVLALMFPFFKRTRLLYVALTATCFVNQAYVLSFLNAGEFIQLGDPVVFVVSLINSLAFLFALALMIKDLRKERRTATSVTQSESEPSPEAQPVVPKETQQLNEIPEPKSSSEQSGWRWSFPKLTRRDLIAIVVLCIVFFSLASYNLGYTQTPVTQTPLYAGQSFYLDLGKQSNVGSVYFLIYDGSYTISVYTGSPENWQVTSNNVSYSDYYKYNDVSIKQTTQYIRVDVNVSTNAILDEIAVSNSSNQQIVIANVTSLDAAGANLHNLIDEQYKVQFPITYMSRTYFDEIYFVRTAEQYLHLQSPYEWTHPPLGKLIQAGGIVVFGFSPFGWRLMGVIFGTLMIPVMYLLGKKLFGTWIGAFTAAFLLTFDFMHFTMARMGTADTYVVFFSILAQLFFVIYFFNVVKRGWKTSVTPLFLSVIFFFLSFSTKWLALYGALGMLALLAAVRIRDLRKLKVSLADKYSAFFDHPFRLLIGFIAVGVGIYFLIYVPDMLTGRPLLGTNGNGVIDLQFAMYSYHANLVATHPFSSLWWSWPIMVSTHGYVPLWLDVTHNLPNNAVSTISVFGNPAVWWVSFTTMLVLTERAIRGKELSQNLKQFIKRKFSKKTPTEETPIDAPSEVSASVLPNLTTNPESAASAVKPTPAPEPAEAAPPQSSGRKWDLAALFIVVVFFSSWIPYVFLTRVTFIYHFYESVPLLCLASAYFINKVWGTRRGKIVTLVFFTAVVALFIIFYPVISGMPVSTSWIHELKWFPSWFFAP
jgi:dolichyl-phosphate-mannose-protein mannosyltransferase